MYILCFMWVMAGWKYYFNWARLLLQALCYQLYKFTTTACNLSYLHYLTFLSVVHAQEQCTLKISYLPTSKHVLFKFSCNIITLLHVNSLCYIICNCLTLFHKTPTHNSWHSSASITVSLYIRVLSHPQKMNGNTYQPNAVNYNASTATHLKLRQYREGGPLESDKCGMIEISNIFEVPAASIFMVKVKLVGKFVSKERRKGVIKHERPFSSSTHFLYPVNGSRFPYSTVKYRSNYSATHPRWMS